MLVTQCGSQWTFMMAKAAQCVAAFRCTNQNNPNNMLVQWKRCFGSKMERMCQSRPPPSATSCMIKIYTYYNQPSYIHSTRLLNLLTNSFYTLDKVYYHNLLNLSLSHLCSCLLRVCPPALDFLWSPLFGLCSFWLPAVKTLLHFSQIHVQSQLLLSSYQAELLSLLTHFLPR